MFNFIKKYFYNTEAEQTNPHLENARKEIGMVVGDGYIGWIDPVTQQSYIATTDEYGDYYVETNNERIYLIYG